MTIDVDALRKTADAHGQGHVFAFWDRLDEAGRATLAAQLAQVDFELLARLTGELDADAGQSAAPTALGPAPVIALPQTESERARAEQARAAGEAALRAGRVGAFLVAGGQGTRLGFDGPKGAFEIGPVSDRTVFQIHADKIAALRKRYGAKLPWVIMTSDATDADTRAFFKEVDYYGLGSDSVRFIKQASMPAVDPQGKLLLQTPGSLALSPNGHGGSIKALYEDGATAWLREQGVDTLFYFQVDNVLVRICDPVFVGYHLEAGADMSSKIVRKRDAHEKVGVIGTVEGKLGVIEYSDLPDDLATATEADGSLRFWAGSIAIHVIDVGFVERLNAGGFRLPFHRARKQVPCIGADGKPQIWADGAKNGVKFETFVFDALGQAKASITMETDRDGDFAPIKNATGQDSPATAQAQMTAEFARWLEAAGHAVPRKPDGSVDAVIELSPLTSLDGRELKGMDLPALKPGAKVVW